MALVEMRLDDGEVRKMVGPLGEAAWRAGAARVLTRAAVTTRVRSARSIAELLRVGLSHVRKRIYSRPASPRRLRSTVLAYSRALSPIKMKARQNSTGVALPGGRWSWPHAFVMKVQSGHSLVALRKPASRTSTGQDAKSRPRRGRLPVAAIKIAFKETASVVIHRTAKTVLADAIRVALPREIRFRMARAAKGGRS